MSKTHNLPRVIVALDYASAELARNLVAQLRPQNCYLKIGKQLFTVAGPALVKEFQALGFNIFLDLKYHDTPNTVSSACAAAVDLGIWAFTVHALGGAAMLQAARQAVSAATGRKPLLIAVTLLTSINQTDCVNLGLSGSTDKIVLRLAKLAYDNGVDGVVCSAQEAGLLRKVLPKNFYLVAPGIRPVGSSADDQQRIMSPLAAIAAGVNYLVIGRPITNAIDPAQALAAITAEINN